MEVIIDGIVYVPKEKSELELMKEKYDSGEYICIFQYLSSEKNVWAEHQTPKFNDYIKKYKLIHKKHKDILDAWLKDNNVEIEAYYSTWFNEDNFIENYNEDVDYRLNEQYTIFKINEYGEVFVAYDNKKYTKLLTKDYNLGCHYFNFDVFNKMETIPYDKEKGLYHLQPVWCWNDNITISKGVYFYNAKKLKLFNQYRDGKIIDNDILMDYIEPITPEQLKVMPFVWSMYQQVLKGYK